MHAYTNLVRGRLIMDARILLTVGLSRYSPRKPTPRRSATLRRAFGRAARRRGGNGWAVLASFATTRHVDVWRAGIARNLTLGDWWALAPVRNDKGRPASDRDEYAYDFSPGLYFRCLASEWLFVRSGSRPST
jgi:hypothetical protein